MAKTFLVIACVCYCTICMHLAATVLAAKLDNEPNRLVYKSEIDSDVRQLGGQSWSDSDRLAVDKRTRRKADATDMSQRSRRHAEVHQSDASNKLEMNSNTQEFVRKLFKRFGNDDQQTMNVMGFERMIEHLGLYRLVDSFESSTKNGDESVSSPRTPPNSNETVIQSKFQSANGSLNNTSMFQCVSGVSLVSKFASENAEAEESIQKYKDLVASMQNQTSNGSTSTINSINSIKRNLNLNQNDLWSLCPILLYQLTSPTSLERAGCVDEGLLPGESVHSHQHHDYLEFAEESRTLGELQLRFECFQE